VSLQIWANVQRGSFTLDVDVTVEEGEVVAVLGPNGSGKSTLLLALCGLAPIEHGTIALDGAVFDDGGRTFITPAARPVGVVFQGNLLFDHMSVLDNLIFGLRARGVSRRDAIAKATPLVERLGLGSLLQRRPRDLSGGQAQRVAIARALVTEPHVLLLDEPMSALDAATRAALRVEFRDLLAGFAGYRLLVTHELDDARALADRVVVLDAGRVAWQGPVGDYRP
jgi:molybdate transport system ATP-binding protein